MMFWPRYLSLWQLRETGWGNTIFVCFIIYKFLLAQLLFCEKQKRYFVLNILKDFVVKTTAQLAIPVINIALLWFLYPFGWECRMFLTALQSLAGSTKPFTTLIGQKLGTAYSALNLVLCDELYPPTILCLTLGINKTFWTPKINKSEKPSSLR